MDAQKKEPNFPYCNLNLITPIKTVRDMNMKCPLFWKIETLKKFIRQHHEDFLDFFKQNSWSLVFGGKTLEEDETIENIIKKVRKINCMQLMDYIYKIFSFIIFQFDLPLFIYLYIGVASKCKKNKRRIAELSL